MPDPKQTLGEFMSRYMAKPRQRFPKKPERKAKK